MLKRFLIIILFLLVFLTPQIKVFAQEQINSENTLTISDAVYADLAIRHYLDNVSVYSYNNNSLDTISINSKRQWIPASTVKAYVAAYAYDQITKGNLNLNDLFTIEAKNVVPTELVTDELPTLQEGDSVTLFRLIKQMITQSDNTAYNVLLDILDRQKVTQFAKSIGCDHTNIGSKLNLDTSQEQYELETPGYGINTTNAEDYGLLFTLIMQNKIAGSKDLFSILSQQKINNMLPVFLPKDVTVAHKTGDLDPLYHDGGIIKAKDRSYVLTIFTNLGDPNVLGHISELIYTKNFDLVGSVIKNKTLSDNLDQTVDPLLSDPTLLASAKVLGASTGLIQAPSVTAADLGIKGEDLTLNLSAKQLPKVVVAYDSPFHFLVDTTTFLKQAISINPKDKMDASISNLALKLSEAKDLESRGRKIEASNLLSSVQADLNLISKDKIISQNSDLQTKIQSISETRFSLLGNNLSNAKLNEKLKLIKEIAMDAKSTVANVQPYLPKALNSTNPTQKPLIGEVVSSNDTTLIIKKGEIQITIPTNQNIPVRSKDLQINNTSVTPMPTINSALTPLLNSGTTTPEPTTTENKLANIKPGTTVAIVGSSSNNGEFTPVFILTNVPRELVAPQPVTVLKINQKNKTLVVEENGVPIQVNVSNNTAIKGGDTNVSFNSIKAGDVVVVHGEAVVPSITPINTILAPTSVPTINPKSETNVPTLNPKINPLTGGSAQGGSTLPLSIISSQPAITIQQGRIAVVTPVQSGTTAIITQKNQPSVAVVKIQTQQIQQAPVNSPATTNAVVPKVIQSTTIQVIEKKQDVPQAAVIQHTQTAPQHQSQPQSAPQPAKSAPVVVPQVIVKPVDKKK